MRLRWSLIALALIATAAQSKPYATAGERFARRSCAGCHALTLKGASPNPLAPPFRTLSAKLPGRGLTSALGQISAHGHRAMPPIYMTPAERRAVAAYIRDVGERSRRSLV